MPFSIEEFLEIFERYNLSIWPIQVILNLLAILVIILIFINKKNSNKVINSILAIFWFWMGAVYHLLFFSAINKAAYLFGILFIIQGLIFIWFGVLKPGNLNYKFRLDYIGFSGILFILYALLIYPVLAVYFGHTYPQMPTFGLPCPTVIFTFGVLLFSEKRLPWYLLTIPFLWSLVGFSAAVNLGIKEDFGLVIAGVLGSLILAFYKPK